MKIRIESGIVSSVSISYKSSSLRLSGRCWVCFAKLSHHYRIVSTWKRMRSPFPEKILKSLGFCAKLRSSKKFRVKVAPPLTISRNGSVCPTLDFDDVRTMQKFAQIVLLFSIIWLRDRFWLSYWKGAQIHSLRGSFSRIEDQNTNFDCECVQRPCVWLWMPRFFY